jgi:hypothetical protein
MSYTRSIIIKLGSTDTGLTLSAKLYDTANALSSTVTTGFTELSGGEYVWLATLADAFRGSIRFYSGGSTYQTSLAVNEESADIIAIKGKTDLIGTAGVDYSSPTVTDSTLEIVRGDDYSAAIGNRPAWSSTVWPDLTGATASFRAKNKFTGDYIDPITCAISGTTTQTVSVPLSSDVTEDLAVGRAVYLFDVQATLASGERVTLITGSMTVVEDMVDAG